MPPVEEHFVCDLLKSLPEHTRYAVARGLHALETPLRSDLDIVVRKHDFREIVGAAKKRGLLLSVALTYGSARVFIAKTNDNIMRIDFVWTANYRGIWLADLEDLLCDTVIDPQTGLRVLAERGQAKLIDWVKNTYGGAEKYRWLLEAHGYRVCGSLGRVWRLTYAVFRRPRAALYGVTRYLALSLGRLCHPAGVLVGTRDLDPLKGSARLGYLFQAGIAETGTIIAFLRSRFVSALCISEKCRFPDVRLHPELSQGQAEGEIIDFLRRERSSFPDGFLRIA